MSLFRIRVSSFLMGAAVAGGFAVYQLRQDVVTSHELLMAQAKEGTSALESRVAALEAKLSATKE